jgi:hypothetical protein
VISVYSGISIRAGGKTYLTCSAEVIKSTRIRAVCRERKRFGRGFEVVFEKSLWDLRVREGRGVSIDDLEFIFGSEDEACRFVNEILSVTYNRVIGEIQKAVVEYLERRSGILGIYARLRRSPRSTLLLFAESLKECQVDPIECLLQRLREEVKALYKGFNEKLRAILADVPADIQENILSAVYLVASLQLKAYEEDRETIVKIIDLIENEHKYSVDRVLIGRMITQQDYKGIDKTLINIANEIFKRIMIWISTKYRCPPSIQ